MIQIIYPDKRWVSEDQILMWAADAYSNNETTRETTDVGEAIEILEDLGHITVIR